MKLELIQKGALKIGDVKIRHGVNDIDDAAWADIESHPLIVAFMSDRRLRVYSEPPAAAPVRKPEMPRIVEDAPIPVLYSPEDAPETDDGKDGEDGGGESPDAEFADVDDGDAIRAAIGEDVLAEARDVAALKESDARDLIPNLAPEVLEALHGIETRTRVKAFIERHLPGAEHQE